MEKGHRSHMEIIISFVLDRIYCRVDTISVELCSNSNGSVCH